MEPYRFARDRYLGITRTIGHWKNSIIDRKPKLLILAYHRVRPEISFDPLYAAVTVKTFIGQIEAVAKRYPIISLTDAVELCRDGGGRAGTRVVFTFDDGYHDIFEYAFPELKKRGLPAAIFLPTDYIDNPMPLWDAEVIAIVARNRGRSFMLKLLDRMKGMSKEEIASVIGSMKDTRAPGEDDRCVSWEDVRTMSGSGIEAGSHGASHRSLARIPIEEAMDEIKRSKESIERNTRKLCRHFAFPFGSQKDYNEKLVEYVKKTGFASSLTNVRGYNHRPCDPFSFKRIIMEEGSDIKALLG